MAATIPPVEVTTRYATTVDTLADAWVFVMDRVDTVGPNPRIEITPVWTWDTAADDKPPRRFEVVVEGMITEPTGGAR